MSFDKHRPHLVVIAEDDKLLEPYNGFLKHPLFLGKRQIATTKTSRGWSRAAETALPFLKNEHSLVLLLIDFDAVKLNGRTWESRYWQVMEGIPETLRGRVLLLGPRGKSEDLSWHVGLKREALGEKIAEECEEGTWDSWRTPLLEHNLPELEEKGEAFRAFLFKG